MRMNSLVATIAALRERRTGDDNGCSRGLEREVDDFEVLLVILQDDRVRGRHARVEKRRRH